MRKLINIVPWKFGRGISTFQGTVVITNFVYLCFARFATVPPSTRKSMPVI